MIFLDQIDAIYPHPKNCLTFNISINQSSTCYLTQSPSLISICDIKNNNKKQYFSNNEKFISGSFVQAEFETDNRICVLTDHGHIYGIKKAGSFSYEKSFIKSPLKTVISCFCCYHSNIICCDDEGNLLFFDKKLNCKVYKFCTCNVKKIRCGKHYGAILISDGSLYYFDTDELLKDNVQFKKYKCDDFIEDIDASNNDIFAFYLIKGFVNISDFKKINMSFKAQKCKKCTMDWSRDGLNLICAFQSGYCYIWSLSSKIAKLYKIEEFNSILSIKFLNEFLVASNEIGILFIPFFKNVICSSPILFNNDSVVEFRATEKEPISIQYRIPEKFIKIIKKIEFVSSDEKNRFFAISGSKNMLLLSRTSGKMLHLKQFSKFNILGHSWIDEKLCVLSYVSESRCNLIICKLIPFEIVKKIEFKSVPLLIQCDSVCCAVAFKKHIRVFSNNSEIDKNALLKVSHRPLQIGIHSLSNQVIVLLSNFELVVFNIDEAKEKVISSNVSHFIIDHNYGFIFIACGFKIFLSPLSNIKFTLFMETSDAVLGVFPNCSSLMSMKANMFPPFQPKNNQFFDLSIVSEMKDPNKAANIVRSLQNSPIFVNLLRQITIFSLREHLGSECVNFLYNFPEYMNEVLVSSLRAVESPERQEVFKEIGKPSFIFMEIANLSMNLCQVIGEFHQFKEVSEKELSIAAIFLPVILEEEGPLIAFPASLFILSKFYDNLDYVESLVRFLDPLLTKSIEIKGNKVICTGMEFERDVYYELKKRLLLMIENCVIKLMKQYLPNIAYCFADNFDFKLQDILKKYKKIDEEFSLVTLLDNMIPLSNNGILSKRDFLNLYNEVSRGNWKKYSEALLLLSGEYKQFSKILDKNPKLKKQFRGTQWQYLIDA